MDSWLTKFLYAPVQILASHKYQKIQMVTANMVSVDKPDHFDWHNQGWSASYKPSMVILTVLKCFNHSAHKSAVVKIVIVDVFQVKEFTQNVSNKW